MTDLYKACIDSVYQLDGIYKNFSKEIEKINETLSNIDNLYVHSNDPFNFILPFLYGCTACLISSSEEVNGFLKKIHDNYANKDGLIGVLLGHQGDYMDKMPGGVFITREGTNSNIGMHRLFWGHDIFSISGDNPFALLSSQYGIFKGIIKAFRHLVVDTFSSQGLPIPFHSWFDYTIKQGDALYVKNKLLDFARKAATEAKGSSASSVEINKSFSHIFTIKAADIATTGINSVLCATHNYIVNKRDRISASQVRLIAYSTQFFGKAMYGAIKTGGIPFISWPTALAVLKELYLFSKINLIDLSRLEKMTSELCAKNLQMEKEIFGFGAFLPSYSIVEDYVDEIQRTERGFNSLLMKFANR